MKTAEKILDEKTMHTLQVVEGCTFHVAVIEAMKEYAKEVAKQSLINASKNSKVIKVGNGGSYFDACVDIKSITNENNIPNLD